MEPGAGASSWILLLTGAACAALGITALFHAGAAGTFWRAIGGPVPGPRESRRVPLALAFTGIAWLGVGWADLYPFAHGARPYAATAATVVLYPLGALAFVGLAAWLAILRRFGR